MNYRENPQNGDKLSILGFGCMRFETSRGGVNVPVAVDQIRRAIDMGVNYFDTAYIYHMGASESVLGQALQGYRDKVKIATKLPHYLVRKPADIDKIFNTQLKRLGTDYIDYYLVHMLTNSETLERLRGLGFYEWVRGKKESGAIRNIGFSFHGKAADFIELLEVYPWEFCQIQYNYLDENSQAGKAGLTRAAEKNLPVIIMEPLRGGKLVSKLPADVSALFGGKSPVEMALRWIWNHPEATVVLSGMSTREQLDENIGFAASPDAMKLTNEELEIFEKVKSILLSRTKIPCTGCGYCMPCPAGVDIPGCFSAYNDKFLLDRARSKSIAYARDTGAFSKNPAYASMCKQCGKCEPHCPQSIPIRQSLKEVSENMEGVLFKLMKLVGRRFF